MDVEDNLGSGTVSLGIVLDPNIYGDDSSSDDGLNEEQRRTRSINNDSNNSSNNESETEEINEKITKKGKKDNNEKKITKRKASEKARAKTMQELASKTQKMVRESRVSLPYHKPKQLTLDEFLKKRNKAKAPLRSSLINSVDLGAMRNVINLEEDVLPILVEVQKDKENELACMMNVSVVLQDEDKKIHSLSLSSIQSQSHVSDLDNEIDAKLEIEESTEEPDQSQQLNAEETTTAVATEQEIPVSNFVTSPEKSSITDELLKDSNKSDCIEKLQDGQLCPDVPSKNESEEPMMMALQSTIEQNKNNKPEESGMILDSNTEQREPTEIEEIEKDIPSSFQQQEATLNAFLNKMNPVPLKKRTVAERLKNMPGFDKIANLKPKLGGCKDSKDLIDFGVSRFDNKHVKSKNEKGIQLLMDRLVKHACTSIMEPQTTPEHFKLHVSKTEKDSQGLLHAVVDEIDYVKPLPTEDEQDILTKCNLPNGNSPREQVPGQKLFRLQAVLKEQIRVKKAKEYEERMKYHATCTEEKNLDYGQEEEEEELLEDEEIVDDDVELSDSDIEEEESDEEEDMLFVEKKKRKRLLYVEDEAEDEDAEDGCNMNDDEDSNPGDDDDGDDTIENNKEEDEDFLSSEQQLKPIEKELTKDQVEIGSLIDPKSDELLTATANPISILVSENVDPSPTEDLVDLCSGKFPSQAPATPYETQNCFGFDDVDDDDDQELIDSFDKTLADSQYINTTEPPMSMSTPSERSESPQPTVLNVDTPKITEKTVRTRSLGLSFEMEARKMQTIIEDSTLSLVRTKLNFENISNSDESDSIPVLLSTEKSLNGDEDDDEEEIGSKVVKKRKRLQFSDDEDDNISHKNDSEIESDHYEENEEEEEQQSDDEEAELEKRLTLLQAEKLKPKGLFGKYGQLRKKFVEEEAQLSGSEEGSGDEDETGLNFYEQEEGDDEELDEEARNQVERVHLKHLLDQDYREIRDLQEKFFDHGDLDDGYGKQRERKFRWNNIDDEWGADDAKMGDSDGDLEDDEEEIKKKLADVERRKWISEHSQLFEASEEESQKQLFENSKFLKLGKSTMKKIESFVENSSSFIMNESSCSVPDISFSSLVKSKIKPNAIASLAISGSAEDEDLDDSLKLVKTTSQPMFASPDEPISKIKKGSFLSRGSPSLSRLAELTKVNDSTNNIKSNSRNFVFSTVTPPDQDTKLQGPKRPSQTRVVQPKKMPRVDRSFSNLDDSSKDSSIFKWFS